MLGFASRLMVGTVVGILFIVAMILAFTADLLDREPRQAREESRRHGTADGSQESLQRLSLQDRTL